MACTEPQIGHEPLATVRIQVGVELSGPQNGHEPLVRVRVSWASTRVCLQATGEARQ